MYYARVGSKLLEWAIGNMYHGMEEFVRCRPESNEQGRRGTPEANCNEINSNFDYCCLLPLKCFYSLMLIHVSDKNIEFGDSII